MRLRINDDVELLHQLFANNIGIFFQNTEDFVTLKQVITTYKEVSRAKLNMSKSIDIQTFQYQIDTLGQDAPWQEVPISGKRNSETWSRAFYQIWEFEENKKRYTAKSNMKGWNTVATHGSQF